MVNLDMDDRLQLITLLKDIPELQTERWLSARRRHRACKFWILFGLVTIPVVAPVGVVVAGAVLGGAALFGIKRVYHHKLTLVPPFPFTKLFLFCQLNR